MCKFRQAVLFFSLREAKLYPDRACDPFAGLLYPNNVFKFSTDTCLYVLVKTPSLISSGLPILRIYYFAC